MSDRFCILLLGVACLGTNGCHSAFVDTTITNQATAIRTIELDYPSQSFGTQTLAKDQVFHYRFKVQGSGPIRIQFTDSAGKQHSATGPMLNEGTEGGLAIVVGVEGGVTWMPQLENHLKK